MAHLLGRINHADFVFFSKLMREHAPIHALDGLKLVHIWHNVDVPGEIVFLFATDDVERARMIIEGRHDAARREDPHANLPLMTYLSE